jgi:hypothetical protein
MLYSSTVLVGRVDTGDWTVRMASALCTYDTDTSPVEYVDREL